MNPFRRATFLVEYVGLRIALFALQAMPLETGLRMGRFMGRALSRFVPKRRRIAADNLRHAFPDLSPNAIDKTVDRVFEHFGCAAVESAVAHRLLRSSTWRQHVTVVNENHLRDVIAEGRGAIIVSAHLGVWELFGLVLKYLDAPPNIVYRPMKNPYVDRFLKDRRAEFGQTMIERKGAVRRLLQVLRRKGYITLLVDQHVRRDAVWPPFFGRPAATTSAPAALALRTGAPIVVAFGCRVSGTYQFEMTLTEPIRPKPTSDRAHDIERVTAEISAAIERAVRHYPDQWLWLHRRWRTLPSDRVKGTANEQTSGSTD